MCFFHQAVNIRNVNSLSYRSVEDISLESRLIAEEPWLSLWGIVTVKVLANNRSAQAPEMPGPSCSSDTDETRCTERIMKWHQKKVHVVFRLQIVRGIEVLSNALFKAKVNTSRVINQRKCLSVIRRLDSFVVIGPRHESTNWNWSPPSARPGNFTSW